MIGQLTRSIATDPKRDSSARRQQSQALVACSWLFVIAVAAIPRFFHVGAQPLWVDEGFSWWDAEQSLANLWNLVPQCDPHPPLYFATLKVWMDGFGDSAGAMRALSAILGVATTVVIVLAGREINARTGWLAGLLFALTPLEVDYGREARPYALLCFGAALMVYATLRLIRRFRGATVETFDLKNDPDSLATMTWIVLIVSCAILLWTNDASPLTLCSLAIALGLLLTFDRSSRALFKPLVFAGIAVVILWLPYLPKLIEQAHGVVSDFWIPPPTAWYVKDTLRMLVSLNSVDAFWWAIALLATGAILMWRRGFWRETVVLVCLIVLPVVFNYAVSETVRSIFLSRTMIGITPAVVVAMAGATMLLRSIPLRASACILLIAAHAIALYSWRSQDDGNEPWDRVASDVLTTIPNVGNHPNAIVLLASNQEALPFSHALEDLHQSLPLQGAPANFPAPGLHARYPSGKCAPSLLGQDLTPLAARVQSYPVVYFITRTDNIYDPGNRVMKLLQSLGFKQSFVDRFTPGALEVHKLVKNAMSTPSPLAPLLRQTLPIPSLHHPANRKPTRKAA